MWLLDASIYKEFQSLNQTKLLSALLPKMCFVAPSQYAKISTFEPNFCSKAKLVVPTNVSVNNLVEAVQKVRKLDEKALLSETDKEIFAYAICTGFGLITYNGAFRSIATRVGVILKNTIELIEDGINSGACSKMQGLQIIAALKDSPKVNNIRRAGMNRFLTKS